MPSWYPYHSWGFKSPSGHRFEAFVLFSTYGWSRTSDHPRVLSTDTIKIGHPVPLADAMSEPLQPEVIPAISLPDREQAAPWRPTSPLVRRPLPLIALAEKRIGDAVYGLSTVDCNGRIADRAILAALGWDGGSRLSIHVYDGLVLLETDSRGISKVRHTMVLHLPVAARRWCNLKTGTRVLLAAYPQGGLLVVHPPAVLDAAIEHVHAQAIGGDPDA